MTEEKQIPENLEVECAECGEVVFEDEITVFEGVHFCENCLDDNTSRCAECGDRIWDDEVMSFEGDRFCNNCFDNIFFQCSECGHIGERDHEPYDYNECNGDILCENCMIQGNSDVGNEIIGTTFKVNPYKRRFGVEIEAENGNKYKLLESIQETSWGLTDDGSLSCTGVEAVSPIMSGDEGYKEITRVCNIMETAGFEPTTKAGVHIHFDFTKAEEADIKRIVAAYYQYDDFWLRMLPASRRGNSYCNKICDKFNKMPEYIFGNLDDIYGGNKNQKTDKYTNQRYTTLNIHSWYYRGTLEVRTHSATLNPTKIQNWISMHQRFFDWALTKPLSFWLNHKPSLREWKEIIGHKLFAYYNDRVKEFQGHKHRVSNKDIRKKVKEMQRMKNQLNKTNLSVCGVLQP